MAWTDPAGHVYAVGEIVSASTMNTYIKDDLIDLDRRTTVTAATVSTSQGTASVTYVDLATSGPAVTVTIGSTGKCHIDWYASYSSGTAGQGALMSYAVSGASTVAATGTNAGSLTSTTGGSGGRFATTDYLTTLTAGSNTFTSKYASTNAGATATFIDRKVLVTPLGS